jgi:hypothetical protein
VDSTAVLVKYVYAGDANLDGTVDTVDFNLLAANFSQSGKNWTDADFNFDGAVDSVDFNLLASNFSLTIAAASSRPSALGSGELSRTVPEPGAIPFTLFLSLSLTRRRRRVT